MHAGKISQTAAQATPIDYEVNYSDSYCRQTEPEVQLAPILFWLNQGKADDSLNEAHAAQAKAKIRKM